MFRVGTADSEIPDICGDINGAGESKLQDPILITGWPLHTVKRIRLIDG